MPRPDRLEVERHVPVPLVRRGQRRDASATFQPLLERVTSDRKWTNKPGSTGLQLTPGRIASAVYSEETSLFSRSDGAAA